MCQVYSSKPGASNINELRHRLFFVKKGNIDSVPSYHHVLTAYTSMLLVQTTKQQSGSGALKAALKYPPPSVLAGFRRKISWTFLG